MKLVHRDRHRSIQDHMALYLAHRLNVGYHDASCHSTTFDVVTNFFLF